MNDTAGRVPPSAVEEYRFLLERGYPRDVSLTMVGNRHTLYTSLRRLLHRAVSSPADARRRQSKLIHPSELAGAKVALDGYNVLITLENGFAGKQMVLADDGVLRDIAGVSSGYRASRAAMNTLARMADTLAELKTAKVVSLFLSSMSRSGELAAAFAEMLAARDISGVCRTERSVETLLSREAEIVVTANSAVMDRATRVFDLAGYVLQREPGSNIMSL